MLLYKALAEARGLGNPQCSFIGRLYMFLEHQRFGYSYDK